MLEAGKLIMPDEYWAFGICGYILPVLAFLTIEFLLENFCK
jgi:hypothetical protein